jgi:anti-sigma B factor antagonist
MEKMNTRKEGDVRIIELEGRLDVHLSMEVESAVNDIIEAGDIFLIFDLENVKYLSSSGLRIFIAALRKLNKLKGQLKLANMNESVKRIFKVVELIDLFDIYPSVDEALESFNR